MDILMSGCLFFLQGHFHARLPVLFFKGIPMPGYLFFSQ
jgi:hypothetical protein